MSKILFILKRRHYPFLCEPQPPTGKCFSSGLRNSVSFVLYMLHTLGIPAHMAEVVDNNSIDREVTAYRPTHVIIEAFWVVPEKFDVLKKLHPKVVWIVRNHSDIPFLSMEGIAFQWIAGYFHRGIEVMSNTKRAQVDIAAFAWNIRANSALSTYGPNYYPTYLFNLSPHRTPGNVVNVGCFGAIRPLKNQLLQAIAAIEFAKRTGTHVHLHMNGTRIEGQADNIRKNLLALFPHSGKCKLVLHDWMDHEKFLALQRTIDIGLQVSFSETFNIVTADAVSQGVPVVVSDEIDWLGSYAHADATHADSILQAMIAAYAASHHRLLLQAGDLAKFSGTSAQIWGGRFGWN